MRKIKEIYLAIIQHYKSNDRITLILFYIYLFFILLSLLVILKTCYICYIYKPDPKLISYLTPTSTKRIIEPTRGSIFAKDGRLLAMSTPRYQIYMDCSVQKEYFKQKKNAQEREKDWLKKAEELAKGLAEIYKDKTGAQYYSLIAQSRTKGKRHVRIGGKIDHETMKKVKALPLFREGQYKGGIIIEKYDSRQYPYGSLARRTIGYVKNNLNSNGNNHIGLEGKFNNRLHGKEGYEWLRITDSKQFIPDQDSSMTRAEDGQNLYTTIDIDIQDIADKSLREQIENQDIVEGGCVIVLDVKTGAIRAMVNLTRDPRDGKFKENYNVAIGKKCEPGSVFKAVTLMSVIEDGFIRSLEETLPTNHGRLKGFKPDDHIVSYERRNNTDRISVLDGFKMSSNYVFRYLAVNNYGKKPRKFIEHIYGYKLGEAFDFELSGLKSPGVPSPSSPTWSGTDLGSIAIGYSISETPLHIATFYNAIANRGKMMKPYLVERFEKYGSVKKKYGKSILNGCICRKSTADTLKRALSYVTEEGTARRLKHAKCKIAGKTGTSWIVLNASENNGIEGKYKTRDGRKKTMATFVGFFPEEAPKYTILTSIYTKLTRANFYGGQLPALTVKNVVDKVWSLETEWCAKTKKCDKVPSVDKNKIHKILSDGIKNQAKPGKHGTVPDLKGKSLADAIYLIENKGYTCSYKGTGLVKSQFPKAGTRYAAGNVISIVLR